jgi:Sulfotransferase domain
MTVRRSAPLALKRAGRQVSATVGTATAGLRVPPGFLLVGGQRCGTTSLYRALREHPGIRSAVFHKGVNYFDVNYSLGRRWYLGHFPLRPLRPGRDTAAPLTFDASGYYMFHPHAPARIVRDLPEVKIVAMVRDPVERAYSAYQHELARGFETETFVRALELEDARVVPELERMVADETYQSQTHRHQAYRRRGHYAEQLLAFIEGLGRHRVHVLESESFFTRPEQEFERLLGFLELPTVMPASFDRYNARRRSPLDEDVRRELADHFAPHDEQLAAILGAPPGWRA